MVTESNEQWGGEFLVQGSQSLRAAFPLRQPFDTSTLSGDIFGVALADAARRARLVITTLRARRSVRAQQERHETKLGLNAPTGEGQG